MPTVSFATNAAAVASIGTSYDVAKVITLTRSATADTGSSPVVAQEAYLADLELDVDIASGSPASGTCRITWDVAGDVICSAEVAFTFLAGLTSTATRLSILLPFNSWKRFPMSPRSTAVGTFYLFLKVNSGTVTVPIGGARLQATDANYGAR